MLNHMTADLQYACTGVYNIPDTSATTEIVTHFPYSKLEMNKHITLIDRDDKPSLLTIDCKTSAAVMSNLLLAINIH